MDQLPKIVPRRVGSPARAQALGEFEARRLTQRIRAGLEDVCRLALEAFEGRAWAALGYASWADYWAAEFGGTERRAYRILDQARVVREIEEAAAERQRTALPRPGADAPPPLTSSLTRASTVEPDIRPVTVTQREAEVLRPRMARVTGRIRAGEDPQEVVRQESRPAGTHPALRRSSEEFRGALFDLARVCADQADDPLLGTGDPEHDYLWGAYDRLRRAATALLEATR